MMAKQLRRKWFTFVFAFTGDCCQRPHLWVQSSLGYTKDDAFRTALKEVRGGRNEDEAEREVFEVVEVPGSIGSVSTVEEYEEHLTRKAVPHV